MNDLMKEKPVRDKESANLIITEKFQTYTILIHKRHLAQPPALLILDRARILYDASMRMHRRAQRLPR